MKLYGSVPHDKARCQYGCCGGKLTRRYQGTLLERAYRKSVRKRARREGAAEISESTRYVEE